MISIYHKSNLEQTLDGAIHIACSLSCYRFNVKAQSMVEKRSFSLLIIL